MSPVVHFHDTVAHLTATQPAVLPALSSLLDQDTKDAMTVNDVVAGLLWTACGLHSCSCCAQELLHSGEVQRAVPGCVVDLVPDIADFTHSEY